MKRTEWKDINKDAQKQTRQDNTSSLLLPSSVLKDIEKDVYRTFPGHNMFEIEDGVGKFLNTLVLLQVHITNVTSTIKDHKH